MISQNFVAFSKYMSFNVKQHFFQIFEAFSQYLNFTYVAAKMLAEEEGRRYLHATSKFFSNI